MNVGQYYTYSKLVLISIGGNNMYVNLPFYEHFNTPLMYMLVSQMVIIYTHTHIYIITDHVT